MDIQKTGPCNLEQQPTRDEGRQQLNNKYRYSQPEKTNLFGEKPCGSVAVRCIKVPNQQIFFAHQPVMTLFS